MERARQGYLELEKSVRSARSGKRPVDGYYVQFWRLLLRYPELIALEMLWSDSLRETYAAIYKTVKTAKQTVPVGWHIWHNNSFNPIYRAEQDLHELSNYSDFIKVVMYNNVGGERMALYADNIGSTLYGDLSKQGVINFNYAVVDFKEPSYDQIPHTGLTADFVFRETKRALEGVAGTNTLIWPGIGIDIPTEPGNSKCPPQRVKEAVLAAFRAGAPGVLLSRRVLRDAARRPKRRWRRDSRVESICLRTTSPISTYPALQLKSSCLDANPSYFSEVLPLAKSFPSHRLGALRRQRTE